MVNTDLDADAGGVDSRHIGRQLRLLVMTPWTLALWASLAVPATPAQKPCPTLAEMDGSQRLLLVRCIPIGAGKGDVERFVPGFETSPYAGSSILSEGGTQVAVLGHRIALRFSFTADSLYAMGYNVDLSVAEGDSLFDAVVAFYSRHYGPPRITDGQDSPYFVKSRTWCTEEYEVVAHCSLADDRRLVGWGFQTAAVQCRKPPRPKTH